MNRLEVTAIVAATVCLVIVVLTFFCADVEEQGLETSNGPTATKTVTHKQTTTETFPLTKTRTVTVHHNQTVTKTFTNMEPPVTVTEMTTVTAVKTRTVPGFENNTAWTINRYLLDRLNTMRELRGLEPLVRGTFLASMAEKDRLDPEYLEGSSQIWTLTETIVLERDTDETWRGDLFVAETVLNCLEADYEHVIYTATTTGVGIYVEVGLYRINVRCAFLGA